MPPLPLAAGAALVVNGAGTGFSTTGALVLAGAFTTTGSFSTTLAQTASVVLALPAVSGTLATLTGVETLSNKTLIAPALGTPASGVATNLTGTAAGLTAGNVTTNANLTGPITSSGNTTSVAAQTGTGTTFVMQAAPTINNAVLTGTTINGVTITTAAAATLTLNAGTTMIFPSASDTVVGIAATQTLTNKSIVATQITAGALQNGVTATTQALGDNSTKLATTAFVAGAQGGVAIRSYLAGLQVSSTTNTTIVIGSGACADDTNAQMLIVTGTTLNCATTGANGLDTGSLANSTWYHAFAIGKTDGTTAFLASTNISSPTFPSGYTLKRRLFSFKTDGSAHILAFTQSGDLFQWATEVAEAGGASPVTMAGVPSGIQVYWQGRVLATATVGGSLTMDFSTPGTTQAGGGAALTCAASASAASALSILTNTSQQIAAVIMSGSASSIGYGTWGWIDRRGRDA